MERFIIAGGRPLHGTARVQGAKNSALPIIAACILTADPCLLHNVPDLTDIMVMRRILHSLGAKTLFNEQELQIDASSLTSHTIPDELMREMRSSVILLGPLVARLGKVRASYPGGCAIGSRPIDLHLKGLQAMGAEITEGGGYLTVEAASLKGAEIHLDYPSVGATENIMMAAIAADGQTTIHNAAMEPEVVDLQNFLVSLGAEVKGAGTSLITITGGSTLKGSAYTIIPDRIVAGTLLLSGVITRGEVTVYPVVPEHLEPLVSRLREMGVKLTIAKDSITATYEGRPKSLDLLRTLPHPGFPTDLQAPMSTALCLAEGTSMLSETVFESRFKHLLELRRMGANVRIEGSTAIIKGVDSLRGAVVSATDLRAGAGLVLAGLVASGITVVEMVHHIDRGYVKLEEELTGMGARIERLKW